MDLCSNEELDKRILAVLAKKQPMRFCGIVHSVYPDQHEGMVHERHVDRRLQALKRKNKIRHNKSIQMWQLL